MAFEIALLQLCFPEASGDPVKCGVLHNGVVKRKAAEGWQWLYIQGLGLLLLVKFKNHDHELMAGFHICMSPKSSKKNHALIDSRGSVNYSGNVIPLFVDKEQNQPATFSR